MRSIKDILIDNNFKFNKRFGQNFLTDVNLLDAIVRDGGVTSEDTVVEVGAGGGALTRALARVARRVVSFEIDDNLRAVLAESLEGLDNVELHFCDALSLPDEQMTELAGNSFKMVSNLPYYITTPLVFKFLELPCSSICVMVQREVADRMVAMPSSESYGVLTLGIALYGKARIARNISRNMFVPAPDVDSAIVIIEAQNRFCAEQRHRLRQLVKAAFSMRRKTLANNLKQAGYPKATVDAAIVALDLGVSVRGEALSLEDFVRLDELLAYS